MSERPRAAPGGEAPAAGDGQRLPAPTAGAVELVRFLVVRPELVRAPALARMLAAPLAAGRPPALAPVAAGVPEELAPRLRAPAAAGLAEPPLHSYLEARLDDGREVLVKVLRPGARAGLERELAQPRALLELLGGWLAEGVDAGEVLARFAAWARERWTLERELAGLLALARSHGDSGRLRVPRPVPELCGPSALVVEAPAGEPLASADARSSPAGRSEPAGGDRETGEPPGHALLLGWLERIYRRGVFQAGAHPEEVLAAPGGSLVLLRWDEVVTLDGVAADDDLRLLPGVYDDDLEAPLGTLLPLLVPGAAADLEGLRRWLRPAVRAAAAADHEEPAAARALRAILSTARQHGYEPAPPTLAAWRAQIVAGATAAGLGSGVPGDRARGLLVRLRLERAFDAADGDALRRLAADSLGLLQESPGHLRQLLADLTEGSLGVEVTVTDSRASSRSKDRRARLVAASVLAVAVASLLGAPGLPEVAGISLGWPLGAVLALLAVVVAREWRRLR